MKIVKHLSAALVLALAAGGLGCAAPADESPAPVEETAPVAQQQQPITQVLAGVQGVMNVIGMIKQTVTYGHPITTGDIYGEQLRLAADISALRGTFSSQVNMLLVNQKASDMNDFDASTTTLWNARRDVAPGKEGELATYVKTQQTVLSFEGLRAFHTTLMGDGLASTGLIDAVADSMSPNGKPDLDKADDLGQVVLHARTVQLEAFSVLSEVWAGSFWNLEKLRAELFANLDAQEARFFERMASFNDAYVRRQAQLDLRYDFAAAMLFGYEKVARDWSFVTDGTRLDVTPRIAIVDATYGTGDKVQNVTGSLFLQCNREGVCTKTFSAQQMGPGEYAYARGRLTVSYRCEGLPGVKTFYWEEANGKPFTLSCSALDTVAGQYTNETGQTLNVRPDRFGTAMWTRFDGASLIGTGVCGIDATTGAIGCQDSLSRDLQPTSIMTKAADASTGLPVLSWKGDRWSFTAQ